VPQPPPLFTVEVRDVPDVRPAEPARSSIAMRPSAFTVEVMRESYDKHIIADLIGDSAPPSEARTVYSGRR
jgi:hypothetical protein